MSELRPHDVPPADGARKDSSVDEKPEAREVVVGQDASLAFEASGMNFVEILVLGRLNERPGVLVGL